MFNKFIKKRVYLDYAAATPLSKAAYRAMEPYLTDQFANPSAIHREGQQARRAVETAREQVAQVFQVKPEFVTFTSGGTESNNLAILGTIQRLQNEGRSLSDMEIVTTEIEHPSVLKTMKSLQDQGVLVKYVQVDEKGMVEVATLKELLSEKTVLFSVAYANSEIGTVQKVHTIKKTLEAAEVQFGTKIYFHLDAAQAPLWLSCQFDRLKADLLSLDAGKCNGPKGIGVLIRSRRSEVTPVLFGGGQESGLRPGTENVAGLVGAAVAFVEAQRDYKERAVKTAAVRDAVITQLNDELGQGVVVNGAFGADRLANNINISIPGLDTEFATVVLDKHGFAVSTKSACAGAGGGESTVVRVISGDAARAASTLRISLAPETTTSDCHQLIQVLKTHIEKMTANHF